MAGPIFDVVSNLPDACGVTAGGVEDAQDNQEELVRDTPLDPWDAGIFAEEHNEVSCAGVLAQAGWAGAPLGCSSQLGLVVEGT